MTKKKESVLKKVDKRIGNSKAGSKPKPFTEKAVNVQVYVKRAIIDSVGGIEKARNIAKMAIENGEL